MHYLTQICKVTIAVFFTVMVTVLFSTLIGCRGCSSEEEVVHWVPASRDTIPEVAVENSLDTEPVAVEEIVVATKTVKDRQPAGYNDTCPDAHRKSQKQYSCTIEELDPDSIKLIMVTSDMEIQITQEVSLKLSSYNGEGKKNAD